MGNRSHALRGDAGYERWLERAVARIACVVRTILSGDRAMSDQNERAAELEALTSIRDWEIDRTRYVVTPIMRDGDQNERAAYIAELRAAFRAEVEQLKTEFIRKLEALYDKHTELAHLHQLNSAEAAKPVRDAPPL